jgi:beta-lactamase regulating signal transducer with metallopeptidase domain
LTTALEFLVRHGPGLALSSSVVLAIGAATVALGRAPLHRHRVAELTLVVALLAALVQGLPIPRPGARWLQDLAPTVVPVRWVSSQEFPALEALGPFKPEAGPTATGLGNLAPGATRSHVEPAPASHRQGPAPTDPGWSLLPLLFLFGAALSATHLLLSYTLLQRVLKAARPAPGWVQALLAEPGRGKPRVRVSKSTARPFCCGLGQGIIVLPEALVRPEQRMRLVAVLRHERAHLTQHHPRARSLAALTTPLFYWHPLYWWLVGDLRRNAELLADDMAVTHLDKHTYVEQLLELAEISHRSSLPEAAGLGALGSRRHFLKRMEHLLMRREPLKTRSSSAQVALRGMCAVLLLGSVSLAWGRTPQDAPTRPAVSTERSPSPIAEFLNSTFLGFSAANKAIPEQEPEPRGRVQVVFESNDPAGLGLFLSLCGDARVELETIGDGPLRRGRVEMALTASLDLAALARVPGVKVEDMTIRDFDVARAGSDAASSLLSRSEDQLRRDLEQAVRNLGQMIDALSADRAPSPDVPRGAINGQVTLIQDELISIDRGSTHGVEVGSSFEVYSGSNYKGRVRVTEVSASRCRGRVVQHVRGRSFELGDRATTDL